MNKTECCQSFEWNSNSHSDEIRWFDSTGYYQFRDDIRIARIELAKNGTAGQYEGFMVTILNKTTGIIDQKMFLFDDYLSRSPSERKDSRPDYPSHEGMICFKIFDCDWKWYIAEPVSTRPFCSAIFDYLEAFGA
jgi:hypothetical protein